MSHHGITLKFPISAQPKKKENPSLKEQELLCFFVLGPHLWHIEFPRLRTESDL